MAKFVSQNTRSAELRDTRNKVNLSRVRLNDIGYCDRLTVLYESAHTQIEIVDILKEEFEEWHFTLSQLKKDLKRLGLSRYKPRQRKKSNLQSPVGHCFPPHHQDCVLHSPHPDLAATSEQTASNTPLMEPSFPEFNQILDNHTAYISRHGHQIFLGATLMTSPTDETPSFESANSPSYVYTDSRSSHIGVPAPYFSSYLPSVSGQDTGIGSFHYGFPCGYYPSPGAGWWDVLPTLQDGMVRGSTFI